jgi:putative transposase
MLYYQSPKDPKTALRARMRELAQVRIRYGYRRLRVLLRREGWSLGKDQTYRLYTEESLQSRSRRPRRRKMFVGRRESYMPKRASQAWSMDFVADQLVDGTRFRALTSVDVYTQESLAIEVGQRLRAEQVVDVCKRIVALRGAPVRIIVDNGSEFSGRIFDLWVYHQKATIDEAKAKIEAWRVDYNESRPRQALKELTPNEYALQYRSVERSADLQPAEN